MPRFLRGGALLCLPLQLFAIHLFRINPTPPVDAEFLAGISPAGQSKPRVQLSGAVHLMKISLTV